MQVTGRVYVRANGTLLLTQEGAKLTNFSGVEREEVVGNEVHGYMEKAVAPGIECTISHTKDTSLADLAAITDATVTFACDTGTVYILRGAWLSNAMDLEAGGGKVPLNFKGKSCEEVRAP